jgi:MinD-like ATPase involved in chromosome partitioning or flagellar assembly
MKDVSSASSWPVMNAVVEADGNGRLEVAGIEQSVSASSVQEAREEVRERARVYARETLQRPVRLRATDPEGTFYLLVHPDGDVDDLADETPTTRRRDRRRAGSAPLVVAGGDEDGTAPAGTPAPVPAAAGNSDRVETDSDDVTRVASPVSARAEVVLKAPAEVVLKGPMGPALAALDRRALHERSPGRMGRVVRWAGGRLKSPAELREEHVDEQLASRHILTRTNLIAVVSPKGGPGKSTLAAVLGDALARFLPNHRVLAVDCNPGGGTLGVMAPDARAARYTLLDLHENRHEVRTRADLQPYVASLASGLDVLGVPPDPHLALTIKPEHYTALLDDCLLNSYEIVILDTSPDITSPVTQLTLRDADQLVLVTEQGYLTAAVVWRALRFLLASQAAGRAGERATIAINKVIADDRAGKVEVLQEQLRTEHRGPQVRIPFDLDLHAAIAAGQYGLSDVRRRATRLALKELTLCVTERFV